MAILKDIGQFDRRITIQESSQVQGQDGFEEDTWVDRQTVFAVRLENSRLSSENEDVEAQRHTPIYSRSYLIRHQIEISEVDRVKDEDGNILDVTGIEEYNELGRRMYKIVHVKQVL